MLVKRLPSLLVRPKYYLTHPLTAQMIPIRTLSTSPGLKSDPPVAPHAPGEHAGTSGGHGGDHYDPPGGWLWGLRPGEKYEKEGWEDLFIYGFFGSFVIAGIAYAFKEDTSIQTWALEEARRRLEKEGILEDPSPETK